jgi:2-oxo-4-hydroxy-4-carboxy--5-ureidoimidazoline (OHCU) decarboxylase
MGKLLTVMEQRPELRKALQVSPTADMTAEDSSWGIERVDEEEDNNLSPIIHTSHHAD